MQKYGQSYGFWLIPSENTTHQEYTEIMARISYVCKETKNQSKKYNILYEMFAMPIETVLGERLYLSVCLFKGYPLFGIFNPKTKQINNECESDILKHIPKKVYVDFSNRCENILVQKSKGLPYPKLKALYLAWSEHIYHNQTAIEKVIQSYTNNNLFLEKEDAINPVMKF